jgi:hypothetical protein
MLHAGESTVNVPETYTFLSQNRFLSMHVCKATIQDYKYFFSKILSFFLIFEIFFLKNDFNFSLFHQNLMKTIFFKNSKITWLTKVWTNKKWPEMPETLISEHLVAVNPCGLQAKKPDFHVSTVKSRNNQIWIFLFEGFNLVHNSSPSTFEVFGTRIFKCSQSSDFGQLWGRFKKI